MLVSGVTAIVSSLGAPLVPAIARERQVSVTAAQFSLSVALLVGALACPLLGRLGGNARRRSVMLAGIAVVALGCLIAALPLGFGWLVVGRAMQGVGLALNPLAFAAGRAVVEDARAASVVGLLAAVNVAGGGLGYLLTGVVARAGGTTAAFLVGLAITIAAWGMVAFVLMPGEPSPDADRVDWSGAALLAVGTSGVLVALSAGPSWGWWAPATILCVVAGAAGVCSWVRRTTRVENPLVDLRLAVRPAALAAHGSTLLVGMGMYVLLPTVVLVVQAPVETGYGLGHSVALAGALLLPYAATSVAGSRVLARISPPMTAMTALATGALLMAFGAVVLWLLHAAAWQIFLGLGLVGLGGGFTFAAAPGIVAAAVPPAETASAIAFNLVLRYLGFALGSALCAAALGSFSTGHLPSAAAIDVALGMAVIIWLAAAAFSISVGPGVAPRWWRGAARADSGGVPF